MATKHHKPLWKIEAAQDPLPKNWKDLMLTSWDLPGNFWTVEEGKLYRSSIVYPKHISVLREKYWIQNIVSLIMWDWLEEFYDDEDIHIHQFPIFERKELTAQRVQQILDVIEWLEWTSIVHCLKWAVRTWMVCAWYDLRYWKSLISTLGKSISHGNVNISALREITTY